MVPVAASNTVGVLQPTTMRIISPAQVMATVAQSNETPRTVDDSQSELLTGMPKKTNRTWLEKIYDWLFQKDFLKLYNLIWVLAAAFIALSCAAVATCFSVTYCRQQCANVRATTLQSGWPSVSFHLKREQKKQQPKYFQLVNFSLKVGSCQRRAQRTVNVWRTRNASTTYVNACPTISTAKRWANACRSRTTA